MNYKILSILFFSLLLLPFCKKQEDIIITEPPEGAIRLSELESRHDYYLPFALENDNNEISSVLLNNETIDFSLGSFIEFDETGFFEMILKYNDPQLVNDTILFTTMTIERETSEWGIRTWIPAPVETTFLASEDIDIIYPQHYTDSIKVPFIFHIRQDGILKQLYCEGICPSAGSTFYVKRGVGSVNITAHDVTNQMKFIIGGKQQNASLSKVTGSAMDLKGTINSHIEIVANTLVRIRNDLEIGPTGSLTINEGSIVLIDEAVNINVSGPMVFSGTAENPVFVTCSRHDKYWGGFITRVQGGTLNAQYTIFCQSGYHDSDGYYWGHSGRQALFYTENSSLVLDNCFMLDHIGQIFYPQQATLTLDNIIVQRAQTGGQINHSDLFLRNSVFTDFPDDSYDFQDADNDALYLNGSNAEIMNTLFMYAKDDGLDSGADDGGEIIIENCRFEACFHEGAALSSRGSVVKNHIFRECFFTNCGQGLELGFSSPYHTVSVDDCIFINNGTGIRYGDNYTWSQVDGKMHVRNSVSLNNDRDVWNMVRIIWKPKLDNLTFENTTVSRYCPQYPELEIEN